MNFLIIFGCHGSTWELDYDKETDYLSSITETIDNAGFESIDIQVSLLGRFKNSPLALKKELENRNLKLAALTIPFSWKELQESEEEKAKANYYIDYVQNFEGAILNIAPRVLENKDQLSKKQDNIINCANNLAKRALIQGVECSFHPSSPENAPFRSPEDYQRLFEGLNSAYIGYTPDAGHIMMGGMNVLNTFEKYREWIKHVHFKDASSNMAWKKMGTGEIRFVEIVKYLKATHYSGWIMMEEETDESSNNPAQAINDISNYIKMNLIPLL